VDPSAGAIALYGCGLVLLAVRPGRRACVIALAGFAGVMGGRAPTADGLTHVTILDVGQGDAIVIRSAGGRAWVVDAGPAFGRRDAGETTVAPYLWSLGIRRIEALVVTHPHPDHSGGVPFLVRAFDVGAVWEGVAPRGDGAYPALDTALRDAAVARLAVRRGLRADWDGIAVEVIGPAGGPPPWKTRNDDSVVLIVRHGAVVLALAGDVERTGEVLLAPGKVFALKVPHHGSRSSTTPGLLESARPDLAIVSAGYRNRFGHPHPDVLERLARAGTRVLRTDRDGSVTLSTDGERIWVATYRDGLEVRYR
jgi:competence protein ComEC